MLEIRHWDRIPTSFTDEEKEEIRAKIGDPSEEIASPVFQVDNSVLEFVYAEQFETMICLTAVKEAMENIAQHDETDIITVVTQQMGVLIPVFASDVRDGIGWGIEGTVVSMDAVVPEDCVQDIIPSKTEEE